MASAEVTVFETEVPMAVAKGGASGSSTGFARDLRYGLVSGLALQWVRLTGQSWPRSLSIL